MGSGIWRNALRRGAPALIAAALPAWGPLAAQELRPAPDYYVEALFSLTLAEAIASTCGGLGMDLFAAQTRTMELSEQLAADGFDAREPFSQMIDPAPQIRALQAEFLARYPLQGADEAAVCAAGRSEIQQDTVIGKLLVDAALLESGVEGTEPEAKP